MKNSKNPPSSKGGMRNMKQRLAGTAMAAIMLAGRAYAVPSELNGPTPEKPAVELPIPPYEKQIPDIAYPAPELDNTTIKMGNETREYLTRDQVIDLLLKNNTDGAPSRESLLSQIDISTGNETVGSEGRLGKRGWSARFMFSPFVGTALCLDDAGTPANAPDGRPVHLWACNVYNHNQYLHYDPGAGFLYQPQKNLCLEYAHDGHKVYLNWCSWHHYKYNQYWFYSKDIVHGQPEFRVKTRANWNSCLAVDGGWQGAWFRVWPCYWEPSGNRRFGTVAARAGWGHEFFIPSTHKANLCITANWRHQMYLTDCHGHWGPQMFRWDPGSRMLLNLAWNLCVTRSWDGNVRLTDCNWWDGQQRFFAADGRIKMSDWGNWDYCMHTWGGHGAGVSIQHCWWSSHVDVKYEFYPFWYTGILRRRATLYNHRLAAMSRNRVLMFP